MNKRLLCRFQKLLSLLLNEVKIEEDKKKRKENIAIKKKAKREIAEYTFKGEFPSLLGMPKKDFTDLRPFSDRFCKRYPVTDDDVIYDLKDLVGFDADWEITPITLYILNKLNNKFYNNRLKIGEFRNDMIHISLIISQDNIYEGYLPFGVSVYKFLSSIEICLQYATPKPKELNGFEMGKFIKSVEACNGNEDCIAKIKEERQKYLTKGKNENQAKCIEKELNESGDSSKA